MCVSGLRVNHTSEKAEVSSNQQSDAAGIK